MATESAIRPVGAHEQLLEVIAGGRKWGIPLTYVVRVSRIDEAQIDPHGPRRRIRVEDGDEEVVLETLEDWGDGKPRTLVQRSQRMLKLQYGQETKTLLVDEVARRKDAAVAVLVLPQLPFVRQPPIAGVFGVGADMAPTLDVARWFEEAEEETPPSPGPSASPAQAPNKGNREPLLMRLPAVPWRDGAGSVIPVLSAAQVLGIEAPGPLLSLPALPTWCRGVSCFHERLVPVFDLQKRFGGGGGMPTEAKRWVLAAVPGIGTVALMINGSCSASPLPDQAATLPLASELGKAVRGFFQVGDERLAFLDLQHWCRADL